MEYEIKLSGERMQGIGDGLMRAYTLTCERLISSLLDPSKSTDHVQKLFAEYVEYREMSEWWNRFQEDTFHG